MCSKKFKVFCAIGKPHCAASIKYYVVMAGT